MSLRQGFRIHGMSLRQGVRIHWRHAWRRVACTLLAGSCAALAQAQEYAYLPVASNITGVQSLAPTSGRLYLSVPGNPSSIVDAYPVNAARYMALNLVSVAATITDAATDGTTLVLTTWSPNQILAARIVSGQPLEFDYVNNLYASALAIGSVGADRMLYALDSTGQRILPYRISGSVFLAQTPIPFGILIQFPTSLAVDGSGNLYVGAQGSSPIYKFTRGDSGYVRSTVANLGQIITGLAVDAAGTLYAGTSGNSSAGLYQFSPDGSGSYTQTLLAHYPRLGDVRIAPDGELFFINDGTAYKRLTLTPGGGGFDGVGGANGADGEDGISPLNGGPGYFSADHSGTPGGSGLTAGVAMTVGSATTLTGVLGANAGGNGGNGGRGGDGGDGGDGGIGESIFATPPAASAHGGNAENRFQVWRGGLRDCPVDGCGLGGAGGDGGDGGAAVAIAPGVAVVNQATVNGGSGGTGGHGGDGGRGGYGGAGGRAGSSPSTAGGLFFGVPGDGGNGSNGGKGGDAGSGGRGGSGIEVGSGASVENTSAGNIVGGSGGLSGEAGNPGRAGQGGTGGATGQVGASSGDAGSDGSPGAAAGAFAAAGSAGSGAVLQADARFINRGRVSGGAGSTGRSPPPESVSPLTGGPSGGDGGNGGSGMQLSVGGLLDNESSVYGGSGGAGGDGLSGGPSVCGGIGQGPCAQRSGGGGAGGNGGVGLVMHGGEAINRVRIVGGSAGNGGLPAPVSLRGSRGGDGGDAVQLDQGARLTSQAAGFLTGIFGNAGANASDGRMAFQGGNGARGVRASGGAVLTVRGAGTVATPVLGGAGGKGGDFTDSLLIFGTGWILPDSGAGGAGGAGADLSAATLVDEGLALFRGGDGGNGGAGTTAFADARYSTWAGNGGQAAPAVALAAGSQMTTAATSDYLGGAGGTGGSAYIGVGCPNTPGRGSGVAGQGRDGAPGVRVAASRLTHSGKATGGSGGRHGVATSGSACVPKPAGGAGLAAVGGAGIVLAGTASGGYRAGSTAAADRAPAVALSGGGNTLELRRGYVLGGNAVSDSGATNGDTLAFGGDTGTDDFDLAQLGDTQRFRGFAALRKVGAGEWRFSGGNAFAGPATVAAGTLTFAGADLGAAAMSVQSGAMLAGNGITGDLDNGGTVAPGNGATAVPGNTGGFAVLATDAFTQTAAGRAEFDIGAASAGDRIEASGAATLAGTVSIRYSVPAAPVRGQAYTLLTSTALSGTFTTVELDGVEGVIDYGVTTPNAVTFTVGGPTADLGVALSGPPTVSGGAPVTYTLTISNSGPDAAAGASYIDTLPATLGAVTASCGNEQGGAVCAAPLVSGTSVSGTLPALPAGASVDITISGVAPFGVHMLTNSASVTPPAGTLDPDSSNDTDTVTTSTPVTLLRFEVD